MEYNRMGRAGVSVSRLGLGAMTFGWQMDAAAAAPVLDRALDAGINLIDTADAYEGSEAILGQILTGRRDKVVLATKIHTQHTMNARAARTSRANIMAGVEKSLAALRTDRIDLYQTHHPDPDTTAEETLEALDRLIKQGKVLHIGTSNHFAWQLMNLLGLSARHGWEPIATSQTCYNLIDRPAEVEVIPFCRKFGVGLLVFSPLCGGVLTGKYRRDVAPPAGTRAGEIPTIKRFTDASLTHDLIEALTPIAADQGVSLAQLSIMWLLAKPVVTSVLLGGSKLEHFAHLLEVADKRLPAEVVARLDEITTSQVYRPWRNQSRFDAPLLRAMI